MPDVTGLPASGTSDPTATVGAAQSPPFGTPVVSDPGSVHVLVGSARTRIVLSGDVDADLSSDLLEAAAEAERAGLPIDVDGQHVTFMDSSGVAFLARLSTRSPERVRAIRMPPTVRFLLEVTRIGQLLDIVDEDPGSDMTFPDGTTAPPLS